MRVGLLFGDILYSFVIPALIGLLALLLWNVYYFTTGLGYAFGLLARGITAFVASVLLLHLSNILGWRGILGENVLMLALFFLLDSSGSWTGLLHAMTAFPQLLLASYMLYGTGYFTLFIYSLRLFYSRRLLVSPQRKGRGTRIIFSAVAISSIAMSVYVITGALYVGSFEALYAALTAPPPIIFSFFLLHSEEGIVQRSIGLLSIPLLSYSLASASWLILPGLDPKYYTLTFLLFTSSCLQVIPIIDRIREQLNV